MSLGDVKGIVVIYDPKRKKAVKITSYYSDGKKARIEYARIKSPEDLDNAEFRFVGYRKSPIRFERMSVDAYRGYYEPVSDEWSVIYEDNLLLMCSDAEDLMKFDKAIKNVLWNLGYEFAICFSSSSNIFSLGYHVMVKNSEKEEILEKINRELDKLKREYRDPIRYVLTALGWES